MSALRAYRDPMTPVSVRPLILAAAGLMLAACGGAPVSAPTSTPAVTLPSAPATAPAASTPESPAASETPTPRATPTPTRSAAAPSHSTAGVVASSPTTTAAPRTVVVVLVQDDPTFGRILVDAESHPLYTTTLDHKGGTPTCTGTCAATWPPLVVAAGEQPSAGSALSDLGVVTRADGRLQVTYKGQPLYRYAQDPASGAVTGNGVGGVWLVAKP